MNIFEHFQSIDAEIEMIKKENLNENEQLATIGQTAGVSGGMGFGGTVNHFGSGISGNIDGQMFSGTTVGNTTLGTMNGQPFSINHVGSTDYLN